MAIDIDTTLNTVLIATVIFVDYAVEDDFD